MTAILLDSDIVIQILRRRDIALTEHWMQLGESGNLVLYSPVTEAEIWHGVRASEREAVENLFSALTCVPVDQEIGRKAGDYLRQFHKSHSVELGDALIAASAHVHGLALWTRNRKHYPMKDVEFWSHGGSPNLNFRAQNRQYPLPAI